MIVSQTAIASRSLWVMKMIAAPCSARLAHDLEQLVGLGGREHGRRLVEDEDVGVAVQRLQDLDPLLRADREVLDQCARVDAQPVLLGELADAGGGGAGVEHAGRARSRPRA